MNVHIVHDGKGTILGVHRTVDGLAHFLMGHGARPVIVAAGDAMPDFGIEELGDAFAKTAIIQVKFGMEADVIVERHGVLI